MCSTTELRAQSHVLDKKDPDNFTRTLASGKGWKMRVKTKEKETFICDFQVFPMKEIK